MKLSRGERNAKWIEQYCLHPAGPQRGDKVQLSRIQKDFIVQIYDGDGEVPPIIGPLAAYLALLHVCGPEYDGKLPCIETDTFTVWDATSEKLREVLQREHGVVRCPELGTQYPKVA